MNLIQILKKIILKEEILLQHRSKKKETAKGPKALAAAVLMTHTKPHTALSSGLGLRFSRLGLCDGCGGRDTAL